jgi:hypothetical protein
MLSGLNLIIVIDAWRKQEQRIARELGGSVNVASGALDRKGDVRGPGVLVEAKWTGKKQFTVRADVVEKIVSEAWAEGRTPIVQVDLNGKHYGLVEWDYILEHERSLE